MESTKKNKTGKLLNKNIMKINLLPIIIIYSIYVGHAKALTLLDKEYDRKFLLAQRQKGRRGLLLNVDKTSNKIKMSDQRKIAEDARRMKELNRKILESAKVNTLNTCISSSSSEYASSSSDSSFEIAPKIKRKYRKTTKIKILSLQ